MDEIAAARAAFRHFSDTYRLPAPPIAVDELAGSLCRLRIRVGGDLSAVAGVSTNAAISGLLLPARHEIWVCDDEPPLRKRFTIAHEIGHHVLHADGATVLCRPADVDQADTTDRARERAANRFAAELLMPEALVRAEAEARDLDVFELAERFAVSDVAMGFRLVNLGYLEVLPAPIAAEHERWRRAPG